MDLKSWLLAFCWIGRGLVRYMRRVPECHPPYTSISSIGVPDW